jgi:hypothetical protein
MKSQLVQFIKQKLQPKSLEIITEDETEEKT